jgi:hypothetical protein
MPERSIRSDELMQDLRSALRDIACNHTVLLVTLGTPGVSADPAFVLGPLSVCGRVCGLIDPEYGWPQRVDVEETTELESLMPGRRRHPFVYLDGKCVAVGIRTGEYQMLRARDSR